MVMKGGLGLSDRFDAEQYRSNPKQASGRPPAKAGKTPRTCGGPGDSGPPSLGASWFETRGVAALLTTLGRVGAQERTRTFTAVKPLAPEASASTNSATWARAG